MLLDVGVPYGPSREPTLRDEILVFVVMAAMFLGLLIIVNFTRSRGRRRLHMSFDEMPLMWRQFAFVMYVGVATFIEKHVKVREFEHNQEMVTENVFLSVVCYCM